MEKKIISPCRGRILICSSSSDANYWQVLRRRKFTEARKESRLKKKKKLEKEKERREEKEEDKSLTYILGWNELFFESIGESILSEQDFSIKQRLGWKWNRKLKISNIRRGIENWQVIRIWRRGIEKRKIGRNVEQAEGFVPSWTSSWLH